MNSKVSNKCTCKNIFYRTLFLANKDPKKARPLLGHWYNGWVGRYSPKCSRYRLDTFCLEFWTPARRRKTTKRRKVCNTEKVHLHWFLWYWDLLLELLREPSYHELISVRKGTGLGSLLNLGSVYLREFLRVYGGAGDEQFEVGSESRDVLDQSEEDVCVQRPLMRLVDYHHAEVKTKKTHKLEACLHLPSKSPLLSQWHFWSFQRHVQTASKECIQPILSGKKKWWLFSKRRSKFMKDRSSWTSHNIMELPMFVPGWFSHQTQGRYLYPPRSGSERNSRSSIPSVMYLISVLSDVQSSNRMLYPTCSNKPNTVPNLQ